MKQLIKAPENMRKGELPLMRQVGFEERKKKRVDGQWIHPKELNRRIKIEENTQYYAKETKERPTYISLPTLKRVLTSYRAVFYRRIRN